MNEDTRIEPGMAEEMRRIAEDTEGDEKESDKTAQLSESERVGLEYTQIAGLQAGAEQGSEVVERDRKFLLDFQDRLKGLAAGLRVEDEYGSSAPQRDAAGNAVELTMDDIFALLPEDAAKQMSERQMNGVRRMVSKVLRDFDGLRTGDALRERTEATARGEMTAEEIQARYEKEADEINRHYDREARLKEFDDHIDSMRGE